VEKKMNIIQVRDALGNLVDEVQYQNDKLHHPSPWQAGDGVTFFL
jgi:hypothetical protein